MPRPSDERRLIVYDLTPTEKEAARAVAASVRHSLSRWIADVVRAELARQAGGAS